MLHGARARSVTSICSAAARASVCALRWVIHRWCVHAVRRLQFACICAWYASLVRVRNVTFTMRVRLCSCSEVFCIVSLWRVRICCYCCANRSFVYFLSRACGARACVSDRRPRPSKPDVLDSVRRLALTSSDASAAGPVEWLHAHSEWERNE